MSVCHRCNRNIITIITYNTHNSKPFLIMPHSSDRTCRQNRNTGVCKHIIGRVRSKSLLITFFFIYRKGFHTGRYFGYMPSGVLPLLLNFIIQSCIFSCIFSISFSQQVRHLLSHLKFMWNQFSLTHCALTSHLGFPHFIATKLFVATSCYVLARPIAYYSIHQDYKLA